MCPSATTFFSAAHPTVPSRRGRRGMTRDAIDLQKAVLLNMDAPQHTRLRKIISRGFTPPRAVGRLEDELRSRAQKIAQTAAAAGTGGDFVEQVSCELPLQAIAGLLGVPQEDRDKLFRWSNEMTAGEDPEYADVDPAMSSFELITYAMKMAEERAKNPHRRHRHDAHRGRHRGREALRRRVRLLRRDARGGRQRDHPQLHHPRHDRVLAESRAVGAVQEGTAGDRRRRDRPLGTPVSAFQRTALEDVELGGGVQIKKGERVVMSYRSANFDDEVFENPHSFDIMRNPPNPHVGFGGTGAHYCIGANLAKMTINLIFNAIADAMPEMKPIGEPERLKSGWLNGIKHWQVDYTGKCPPSPGLRRITPEQH